MGEKWTEMLFMKMVSAAPRRRRVQKKRIGSLCRGGVLLPRLILCVREANALIEPGLGEEAWGDQEGNRKNPRTTLTTDTGTPTTRKVGT